MLLFKNKIVLKTTINRENQTLQFYKRVGEVKIQHRQNCNSPDFATTSNQILVDRPIESIFMQNLAATIQCSNPHCLAFNKIESQACQRCGTPIVKRYLRVLGDEINNYKPGELIGDRYLLKQDRIVLDTRPAIAPDVTEEIPDRILPYLQLFSYRLHIPQVYGLLLEEDEEKDDALIWLLEYGTVPTDSSGNVKSPELLTKLTAAWPQATDLRQLNWLWQIARLWQPLATKKVASSLLDTNLLRVNGPVVQLLELVDDGDKELTLTHLCKLWLEISEQSSENIKKFLESVCEQVETEQVKDSEELIKILDRGIEKAAKEQKYTYQIFTLTDSGPSRSHNEDACYPTSRKQTQEKIGKSVAIVCDGIGGHASGEVASKLAIDTILENLQKTNLNPQEHNSIKISLELEKFACAANDAISDRNDNEQRQERQRMGTTLAMSLGLAHQMYLAYVGDSRIYWITDTGCYPVSVDDDLASREVQLGYAFYRDALQYPNSGALVQALGMESSVNLRPSVERVIVDEDCVFLLCSDGLSDYDRVEQYWQSKIAPILNGEISVAEAGSQLLEIANNKNGHDNVTIAIVHCQVGGDNSDNNNKAVSWSSLGAPGSNSISSPPPSPTKSSFFSDIRKPALAILTSSILLCGLGIYYNKIPNFPKIIKDRFSPSSSIGQESSLDLKSSLEVGDAIEVAEETGLDFDVAMENSPDIAIKRLPKGSILQVVEDRKQTDDSASELILKVCYLPELNPSSEAQKLASLQEGELGSIKTGELAKKNFKNASDPHLPAKCHQSTSISNSRSK